MADEKAKRRRSSPEAKQRWQEENRERSNLIKKRYEERHPDRVAEAKERYRLANHERVRDAKRRWATENALKDEECKRTYREANREKTNRATADWSARNPDRRRAASERRRAWQAKAFVEDISSSELYQRDGGICQICWKSVGADFEIDHIIPLSRGGEHSYANTQIAHPGCNRAKGANLPTTLGGCYVGG